MIYKQPSIYKSGEEFLVEYKEIILKPQSKYTQIIDYDIKVTYSPKIKIAYLAGWFTTNSNLTPYYTSTDNGGTNNWPALFYNDELPQDFIDTFSKKGTAGIAYQANMSNLFASTFNFIESNILDLCFLHTSTLPAASMNLTQTFICG